MVLINRGHIPHEHVFDGLDKYEDGTMILWRGTIHVLVSHKRSDGVRSLGLKAMLKWKEPKRNEKCFCGSNKKYKKCCWAKINITKG